MICEVLYKVGDGRSYADGMPIEVRPSGVYITAAEVTSWLAGTEPASVSTLSKSVRGHLTSFISLADAMSPSKFDLAAFVVNGVEEAEVLAAKTDIESRLAKIQADGGVDTTWGLEEIKTGSVMIADMSMTEAHDLVQPVVATPPAKLRPEMTSQRGFVIPYAALLSSDTVEQVRNDSVVVQPARGETPIPFAQLVTEL